MLKLNQPAYSYVQTMASCREGITGNANLLQKLGSEIELFQVSADSYVASASQGELYTLQSTPNHRNCDPIVIGSLKSLNFLSYIARTLLNLVSLGVEFIIPCWRLLMNSALFVVVLDDQEIWIITFLKHTILNFLYCR